MRVTGITLNDHDYIAGKPGSKLLIHLIAIPIKNY
jgi:hypothetical protein